jgi:hypothetical protein
MRCCLSALAHFLAYSLILEHPSFLLCVWKSYPAMYDSCFTSTTPSKGPFAPSNTTF